MEETERLLTVSEVAAIFRVDPRTISRWRIAGKLAGIQTPGGRDYRYRESYVRALLGEKREA
jgi:excisionase family DNA binding protein